MRDSMDKIKSHIEIIHKNMVKILILHKTT